MDEAAVSNDILRQALLQRITVNGVAPRKLAGAGFGIVATKDHDVSFPLLLLRHRRFLLSKMHPSLRLILPGRRTLGFCTYVLPEDNSNRSTKPAPID